jgi:hypothetical protein
VLNISIPFLGVIKTALFTTENNGAVPGVYALHPAVFSVFACTPRRGNKKGPGIIPNTVLVQNNASTVNQFHDGVMFVDFFLEIEPRTNSGPFLAVIFGSSRELHNEDFLFPKIPVEVPIAFNVRAKKHVRSYAVRSISSSQTGYYFQAKRFVFQHNLVVLVVRHIFFLRSLSSIEISVRSIEEKHQNTD